MDPSPEPQDVPASIGVGLAKLGLLMRHHAWKEANNLGLTPTQGQILAFLQTCPERCAPVGKIAEALAVTPATTSDAIQALAAKGLVMKVRSVADARVVEVRLTEAGSLPAQSAMVWPEFLTPALKALSPKEQGDFLQSLVVMVRELQQQGQIPIARMCPSCINFRPNQYPGSDRPHFCTFVNAPIGNRDLQLACDDHVQAPPAQVAEAWTRFRQHENLEE